MLAAGFGDGKAGLTERYGQDAARRRSGSFACHCLGLVYLEKPFSS